MQTLPNFIYCGHIIFIRAPRLHRRTTRPSAVTAAPTWRHTVYRTVSNVRPINVQYMHQPPHTAYVRIYTSMCRCAVTMEDDVSTFFSCGKNRMLQLISTYKITAYWFSRESRKIRPFCEGCRWKEPKTPGGGWWVPRAPSPVLTVLIVVNQRCGQFPLQLYGLMCQTSNSSQ
jgi:hypothetical protein